MFTTLSPVTALAQLHIDTRTLSPTTVCVVVAGEVDLAGAPILRARLLDVIHDQAPEVIDVDLAGVRFLDCAGLGVLVAAHDTAAHAGCHLWVTHPQPTVHRILELTGLLDLLTAPTDQQPPTVRAIRVPARGTHPSRSRAAVAPPDDGRSLSPTIDARPAHPDQEGGLSPVVGTPSGFRPPVSSPVQAWSARMAVRH